MFNSLNRDTTRANFTLNYQIIIRVLRDLCISLYKVIRLYVIFPCNLPFLLQSMINEFGVTTIRTRGRIRVEIGHIREYTFLINIINSFNDPGPTFRDHFPTLTITRVIDHFIRTISDPTRLHAKRILRNRNSRRPLVNRTIPTSLLTIYFNRSFPNLATRLWKTPPTTRETGTISTRIHYV